MVESLPDRPSLARVRQAAVAALRAVRPEEWLIAAVLVALWGACVVTGTGFTFSGVAKRYVQYFAIYILVLVAVARLALPLVDQWRPRSSRLRRIKRWAFGDDQALESLLRVDVELVRGFAILVASLTVYTNVKTRMPVLRPETFDVAFAALDQSVFGGLPETLRTLAANDGRTRTVLADAYTHDWFYMMGIVYLGYFRRDVRLMRWAFNSVALVYLVSIAIALGIPTQAPFYLDEAAYTWDRSTSSGRAQDYLIDFRRDTTPALDNRTPFRVKAFAGIVSFPAVDVAQLIAAAWIGWRVFWPWAFACLGVAAFVYMATLAFGWGYAIDGVAAVGVGLLCAEGVRFVARWRPAEIDPQPSRDGSASASDGEERREPEPEPA